MTPQQRRLIRELVKKYSENVGTESLIVFVAGTHGMLAAGKTFLLSMESSDSSSTDWLLRDCSKHNVVLHSFLEEISRLTVIFDPNEDKEEHFATLGISPQAGRDEIKQAYRTLSLQHHPDTASPQHHYNPEKFIEINKAYHALLTTQTTEKQQELTTPKTRWRKSRTRRFSIGQKKKLFIWASAGLVVLAVVSTIASINIKNRAMLAGLQRGRTVSAVPVSPVAETIPKNKQAEAVTNHSNEPQNAAEKKGVVPPSLTKKTIQTEPIAQRESKSTEQRASKPTSEQPLPEPETIAKTTKTLNTVTKVAKKTQEKQLAVVHVAQQHFKSKSASTDTSIHVLADTLPISRDRKTHSTPRIVNTKQFLAPAEAIEGLPVKTQETITKKQTQPDIQSKIDTFLANYIKAYQQRNLILFSRYFEADAIENGKPFTSMLPTYSELFATTSDITFKVEKTSWQLLEGKVELRGSFKLHVQYNDSHLLSGSGPINLVLMEENGSYLVSNLEYDFLVH